MAANPTTKKLRMQIQELTVENELLREKVDRFTDENLRLRLECFQDPVFPTREGLEAEAKRLTEENKRLEVIVDEQSEEARYWRKSNDDTVITAGKYLESLVAATESIGRLTKMIEQLSKASKKVE